MQIESEISLAIPDLLVDEIANRVVERVVVKLGPVLGRQIANESRTTDPDLPAPTFLRLPEVAARVGVARGTVYKWITEGRFPPPVKLGGRSVAWRIVELEEWEALPEAYLNRD